MACCLHPQLHRFILLILAVVCRVYRLVLGLWEESSRRQREEPQELQGEGAHTGSRLLSSTGWLRNIFVGSLGSTTLSQRPGYASVEAGGLCWCLVKEEVLTLCGPFC